MSSHSLPSFAQAFSALDDRSDRALPPIHHAPFSHPRLRHDSLSRTLPPIAQKRAEESRKRPLEREDSSEPPSPRPIKQEDNDQLDPSPPHSPPSKAPVRARQQLHLNTNLAINPNQPPNPNPNSQPVAHTQSQPPKPSSNAHLLPSSPSPTLSRSHPHKRRRVTISGVAHPSSHTPYSAESPHHGLHHYHHHPDFPASHTPPGTAGSTTPISPVVMGFTMNTPENLEQVRAMLAVKQKQKALIESRRGSITGGGPTMNGGTRTPDGRRGSNAGMGIDSVGRRASFASVAPSVNVVNPTPTTATGPGPSAPLSGPAGTATPLRRSGSSPNGVRMLRASASVSPNIRTTGLAGRTRSPSLLGQGAQQVPRAYSPSHPPAQSLQIQNRPSERPAPNSNPSGPGHATHSPPNQQLHGEQPAREARPQACSPPRAVPSQPHAQQHQQSAKTAGQQANVATASSSSMPISNSVPISATVSAAQGLTALAHNLPPPPNSFARRRASHLGMRGNKPADLLISPRERPSESGAMSQSTGDKTLNSGSLISQNSAQARVHSPSYSLTQSQVTNASSKTASGPSVQASNPNAAIKAFVPISNTFKMHQPVIQTAPPRPGQQPGRFPESVRAAVVGGPAMAIPSLPLSLSQSKSSTVIPSIRRQPGQVPPTPTRLLSSLQGPTNPSVQENVSVRLSQPTRGPPRTATGATFAIPHGPPPPSNASSSSRPAGMLGPMPATPATLNRPSGSGSISGRVGASGSGAPGGREKAAFLAPFELFYDALSDAQVLKNWFGEQLRRVGAVVREGEAQVERLKGVSPTDRPSSSSSGMSGIARNEVERMVREAVMLEARAWREEVEGLRGQVTDLQRQLAATGKVAPGTGGSITSNESVNTTTTSISRAGSRGSGKGKSRVNGPGSKPNVNGTGHGYPAAPGVESFTFPSRQRPIPSLSSSTLHPPPSSGSPRRNGTLSPSPSQSNGVKAGKVKFKADVDPAATVAAGEASGPDSEEMNATSSPAPTPGAAPISVSNAASPNSASTPIMSPEQGLDEKFKGDAMEVEDGRRDLRKRLSTSVSAMRYEKNERTDTIEKTDERHADGPEADAEKNQEGAEKVTNGGGAAMDESP